MGSRASSSEDISAPFGALTGVDVLCDTTQAKVGSWGHVITPSPAPPPHAHTHTHTHTLSLSLSLSLSLCRHYTFPRPTSRPVSQMKRQHLTNHSNHALSPKPSPQKKTIIRTKQSLTNTTSFLCPVRHPPPRREKEEREEKLRHEPLTSPTKPIPRPHLSS